MALEGRLGVLARPVAVGSLVVLAANDHVLKDWSAHQGVVARSVTGKASDVAGVLLLTLLVGAITGRRRTAVVAVGVGFTALKLSPAVADLAVPVLGGTTRTDPWDLLALAALVPAWRALATVGGPAPERSAHRPRPGPHRVGLAVLVASVPVVTATSPPAEPCVDAVAVEVLVATDDGLVAAVGIAGTVDDHRDLVRALRDRDTSTSAPTTGPGTTVPEAEPPALTWFASDDVGRTWTEVPEPSGVNALLLPEPLEDACTRTRCFAVSGSSVASQDRDTSGPWSVREGPPVEMSTSTCSGASARVVSTDEVLVAVDGDRGLLRWTEADQAYERVSVGDATPAPVHLTGHDDDEGDDGDGPADDVRSAVGRAGDIGRVVVAVVLTALLVGALLRLRRRGPSLSRPRRAPATPPTGPQSSPWAAPARPTPPPPDPGDATAWARPPDDPDRG